MTGIYKRFPNKGFAVGHAQKVMGKVSDDAYAIGTDADEVAKEGGGTEYLAVVVVEQFADKLSPADAQIFTDAGVFVREQPRPEDIKEREKMEVAAAQEAAQEVRTVEVQAPDGQTVSAEVKAGRAGQPERNGVVRPRPGSLAATVWDAADRMSSERGRPVTGLELRTELFPKGFSSSVLSQQYSRWRQHWGVTDEAVAQIESELDAPARAAAEAQKAEEQRLREEERALRREAKAMEKLVRAEEKKRERMELKAAKARSKEEGRAVKEAQRSEESQRKLEERIAKNAAVAAEKLAENARRAAERQAEREKRLEARAEEYRLRNEAAKAKLEEARAKVEAIRAQQAASAPAPTQEEADTAEALA